MTPEKLQLAKDELKKFYLLLCPFVEYFKSGLPHYQMIEVLIQHAQFNALGCQGYDHKAEVKKLYEIQKLLYLLKTHQLLLEVVGQELQYIIEEVTNGLQWET